MVVLNAMERKFPGVRDAGKLGEGLEE